MKIYTDKDGFNPDYETYRSPSYKVTNNPNYDNTKPISEDNKQYISVEIPFKDPRPFKEVEDDIDISSIYIENGEVKTITPELQAKRDNNVLELAKRQADTFLNGLATQTRNKYRSPDKDATYQNKSRELDLWIGAGRSAMPNPDLFKYISKEAIRTGKSFVDQAELIEQMRDAWEELDSNIESAVQDWKTRINGQVITSTLENALATIEELKGLAKTELGAL